MPAGNPLGYSFAPGADVSMDERGRNGGARGISPQEAVRILSLRVPERLPTTAPVARELLTSPGGAAAGAQGLNSMVAALIQAFKPQLQSPVPMPSAPPPRSQAPIPSRSGTMPPTQAPSTRPSPAPSAPPPAPVFEGHIDTPPMQNAPGLWANPEEVTAAMWQELMAPWLDFKRSVSTPGGSGIERPFRMNLLPPQREVPLENRSLPTRVDWSAENQPLPGGGRGTLA